MKIKTILLSVFSMLMFSGFSSLAKGHNIKIKVKGVQNKDCIVAYYFGDSKYVHDTVTTNENGIAKLEGDKPLDQGIYMFVLPSQNYFEFVVHEQEFTLKTEKPNLVQNMKVKGSKENQIFYEYIRESRSLHKQTQKLQKELKEIEDKESEEYQKKQKELKELRNKTQERKKGMIEKLPDGFYTNVLKTMQNPEYPEIGDNGMDSAKAFNTYRKRFLESVEWGNESLLRTPVYHNKFTTYIEDLTPQHPDSIKKAADKLISRTDTSNKTFQYVVNHITTKYERSKRMGMDKVFVHMAQNYYLSGMADWVSEDKLKDIKKRVLKLKHNLIGKTAANLTMKDINDNSVSLHDIDKELTIVYFWDSECGVCKETTPKLKDLYDQYEDQGVEVYAVNIEQEEDGWKEYVNKNDLHGWINVQDPYHRTKFRQLYNIYSTPVIYVLDENKEIKLKRISVDQLKEVIPKMLKDSEELQQEDFKTQKGNPNEKLKK